VRNNDSLKEIIINYKEFPAGASMEDILLFLFSYLADGRQAIQNSSNSIK
jgi:hypothetical protein